MLSLLKKKLKIGDRCITKTSRKCYIILLYCYFVIILLYVVLYYMTLQNPYISIENNYMKMLIYIYCYIVIYVVSCYYVIILLYVVFYYIFRGVARVSRRWGSKLVPTKTVGLKSLDYARTRLWRYANRRRFCATQTEDALIAVERMCLSLSRYLCLADFHPLHMVDLRYVFNLLSVLNERSHSADVIGNVHKMQILVWMLEKNFRSHAASV